MFGSDRMTEAPKYTREEVKKHIADLKDSFEHTLKLLESVFDTAFELDWNAMIFKNENAPAKAERPKRAKAAPKPKTKKAVKDLTEKLIVGSEQNLGEDDVSDLNE